MFHGDQWMWGMHGGWWIGGLVLLIILAWAFSRRNRAAHSGPQASATHDSALDVLKRRYAEGEITTDEFEERKRNLEQG